MQVATGAARDENETLMNTRQLITPMLRPFSSVPPVGVLTELGASALLGWIGLTRRHGRLGTQTALVAVGALVGAGVALLLAPSSGTELRSRLGKGAGGALGASVGKFLGEQAGGHPLRTAKIVGTAQEVLGPKPS
jgi:hypothetical protein